MNRPAYLIRLGDALSQFFNVLLLRGDPNYSISGDSFRFNRMRMQRFIDKLFSPFEDEHCKVSYANDVRKSYRMILEHEKNFPNWNLKE